MCKYPKSVFLLVDDEDSILKILSKQLNFWGYSSEKANSGLAALEKISDKNYDLIFLDMNLEDMSGLEVLEEIHKINDLTQVIMVTSLNHVEYFRSAIREGAFDYIVKPWSRSDLRDTIIRALEYRRFLVMKQESYTTLKKAIEIISANSGDQFYPEVVKSLNSLTEIELSQWEVTNAR